MASTGIKAAAQAGFAAAAAYDAHRPNYPAQAADELLQNLEVKGVDRARIMDLAAGTGKFTELLSARPENFEIVAVEPHDKMRAELEQKSLRGVTVVKAAAEDLSNLEDGLFAAVVASQSFHWFCNMTALKEIARVLQPTGVLGMIWNIDDYNSPRSWDIHPGWESKMRDVVWTFDDDVPRFRHEKWKQVFDEQSASNPLTLHFSTPLFGLPLGEDSVEFETWQSKEDVWKRILTLSQFAILEGDELEEKRSEFFEAINSEETQMNEQGLVSAHGRTYFAWTSRIPDVPIKSGG